jgi:2-phospho-L-lactate guanylyltransferase
MNAALIPVRSIAGAKNRLAAALDATARRRLTLAMLADMVAAARSARSLHRTYVLSADAELLDHAAELGADVLREHADATLGAGPDPGAPAPWRRAAGGLNAAVAWAARRLAASGVERLITIPGDVPLMSGADVDALFAASTPGSVVLAPSASGTGTNALLTSPPDLIAPRFEGASLAAHRRACEATGVRCTTVCAPSFALDVDTLEDLHALASSSADRESPRVAAALLAPARAAAAAVALAALGARQ